MRVAERSRKHSDSQSQSHTRGGGAGQRCSGTGQTGARGVGGESWGGGGRLHTQELRTYILDIVSGYGLVVNIDRPLGYYYDIQPFHPRSILQGRGGGGEMLGWGGVGEET